MKNNALSEGKINALKPRKAKNGSLKDTIYRDGSGLYLLVTAAKRGNSSLRKVCLSERRSGQLSSSGIPAVKGGNLRGADA